MLLMNNLKLNCLIYYILLTKLIQKLGFSSIIRERYLRVIRVYSMNFLISSVDRFIFNAQSICEQTFCRRNTIQAQDSDNLCTHLTVQQLAFITMQKKYIYNH